MRIVMISDTENSGGAAIAASRLAHALIQTGQEVIRIVGWPATGKFQWKTEVLRIENSFFSRVARRTFSENAYGARLPSGICTRLDKLLEAIKPDFINVHNLHACFRQGWRPQMVQTCAQHAPTIWTLHDMWSFTGRCAYSYDCEKFITGCDETCPTPDEYPSLEPSKISKAWQARQQMFGSGIPFSAVTPSEWLAREAKRGFWGNRLIRVIPHGLPLDVYRPMDRILARDRLGIRNVRGFILLVTAHNLSDRRKGIRLLLEALNRLKSCVTVVTMGADAPSVDQSGIQHIPLGYIEDEETKVLAYNSADLFVHPALFDNLPNVLIESIACGTPVVALRTGGIPEVVRQNGTGWLSDLSADHLADVIRSAFDSGISLRDSCRKIAEEEYSANLQAMRYIELMRSLCATQENRV